MFFFGRWMHKSCFLLWSLNPSLHFTSLLQCDNSLSLPCLSLLSFIFLYTSSFSPETSSFHSFCLPNPPLPPSQSPFSPLSQYLHPHPSIFGCSSRPPANPLISSHLCLSRTISSTHSPIQCKCACVHCHTLYYTSTQPTTLFFSYP